MIFSTDFAHVHGKPNVEGKIRHCEQDFKVFEVPSLTLSGAGEHVFLKIRKTGANTGWVAGKLAEFAGLEARDVGFAGRKDRHAVTEQWFSCYLPGGKGPEWDLLEIEGVELLETTRHAKKLRRGDLDGNQFELTVRGISDHGSLEEKLFIVRDSGVPNYFGEQRFGFNNNNLQYADRLLKGDRSVRRNRDIYLSAARSYMFNHLLSDRITKGDWDEISEFETGQLYGMSRDPRPGEDLLPLECESWCNGLQKLRVKTGSRNLKLKAKDLRWEFDGDTVQLSFCLPAGSFATSLLREVLDYRAFDGKAFDGRAGEDKHSE
jgi:tRNA pseudouridine13 synthase